MSTEERMFESRDFQYVDLCQDVLTDAELSLTTPCYDAILVFSFPHWSTLLVRKVLK